MEKYDGYWIDYEGCPLQCTKEEHDKEMERLNFQCGKEKASESK